MDGDEAATVVTSTFEALMGAEPEVAQGFLIAATYVRAILTGDSPQGVLDALFTAMPDAETWPSLRDALLAALEPE